MKLDQLSMEYMSITCLPLESLRHRQGQELQRLSSAFSALELDSQERHSAAERSCGAHVKHLEELIRSSQRRLALAGQVGCFFPYMAYN